ncbi:uncharacterized protein BKA55DRAFT_614185 [Fusarium redolens]|uniref:Uncharacterized protein n=1 Tax=Fusarium redolens TaxID=48865 RepID=A0A9P9HAT3_FUSRE|nr:uncharacterized protein BKA55DRAFT_614185 [Fusarium redolens]KAH7254131.1 hypothetical protein BKA55DRAFT_614185 [Fusarium redolens]
MSQFTGFSWTTPRDFIKSCREESPRSKYINDLVERIKSEVGSGTTVLLQETLKTYIHPDNLDLALTTVNLFSNWKRLHEFLELADQSIKQNFTGIECFPCSTRKAQKVRFPSLLTCSAVEYFFARVQRAFWLHEFALRRRFLEVGWSTNQIQIPGDRNPAHILQGFLQRPDDVDIGRFLGAVQSQRFVGTMLDHGIEDDGRRLFLLEFRDQLSAFPVATRSTPCNCCSRLPLSTPNRGFSGEDTIFNPHFGMMAGLRNILSLAQSSTSHLASTIPALRGSKNVNGNYRSKKLKLPHL